MSKLKIVEVMKRARFLRDGEKMILKFDLSNLNEVEDIERITEYFRSMVMKMPKKSIVGLVDFTDLKIADEVVQEMIQLTEFCNPYFRATAAITNSLATTSLVESVANHFGDINMPIFQAEEPAKEWLFSQ